MIDGKEIVKALLATTGGTESNTPEENFRYLCQLTGYKEYPLEQDLPSDLDIAWMDLDTFIYNKILKQC